MALCPDGHQSGSTDYCDECGLSMGAASAAAPGGSGYPSGTLGTSTVAMTLEPCPNCLLPRSDHDDPFCEGCGFDFANQAPAPTPTHQVPAAGAAPVNTPANAPIDIEAQLRLAEEAAIAAIQEAETQSVERQNAATQAFDPLVQTVVGPTAATSRWALVANSDRAYYDAVVAEGEIDPHSYPFPPFCPERRFTLDGDNLRIGRSSATKGTVEIDLTGPPTDPGVSHLHAVLQSRPDGGWTVSDPGSTNGTVLNDDTASIPQNQAIPVEEGFRIHVGVWTTLTLVRE
jgi:hypothetical protein